MERYRRFITVWYESATIADVCAVLQLDRRAVSNFAAYLRRNGVTLPPKPSGRTKPGYSKARVDWHELRTFAAIMAGREAAERYRRGA